MFKLWCDRDIFSHIDISLVLARIVIFNFFAGIKCCDLKNAKHRILIISCDSQKFSKSMKGIGNHLPCVGCFIVKGQHPEFLSYKVLTMSMISINIGSETMSHG